MKVTTHLGGGLGDLAESARLIKGLGFDGVGTTEVQHDPLVVAAAASQHLPGMELSTGIAVAFARTPMVLAYSAHDVNELTGGRFVLGLGTQVRAHVTRRFGMPWSGKPVTQMKEYVLALKHIWNGWRHDEAINFVGDTYEHTLMTPYFVPPTSTAAAPKVTIAAVGANMARAAAEVADGVIPHGFWTRTYHDEVLLPAINEGLAKSGRSRSDLIISAGGFTVTGETEEEFAKSKEFIRYQIAFYGSTPTYRPVWEVHDLGDFGDTLHELSIQPDKDKWQRMTALVTDEIIDLFAVQAEAKDLGEALVAAHGDYADRISLSPNYDGDLDIWKNNIAVLRRGAMQPA